MSNALQVATINGIGDFILFLGKVSTIKTYKKIVSKKLFFLVIGISNLCNHQYFITEE